MTFHLAQVNVAYAKFSSEEPHFAGFVDNLQRVYVLVEDAFTFRDFFEAPNTMDYTYG
jgi:hypothetical protein